VLSTFAGHGESVRDECEAGHLTRALLRSLKTLLKGLETTESPVVVILVSAGLLQPLSSADRVTRQSSCLGMRPDMHDYADVGKAAARLRGQFYVIQPHTFTTVASERQSRDGRLLDERLRGLEDLVGIVGGQLFRSSGTPSAAFDRIARESSGYYLLGFESEPSERDGKSHRIELRASRPNVRIRARPEFTIEKKGS
jgi:hypothetical protein